ncbi:MAG: hypothetical protein H7A46_10480 [Verrucomicrobiales bacterium]|nr:hypothetical protein [Verrucomicrobiales bacterium]
MEVLQLNETERELLAEVLKNRLAALEVEITHTDRSEFRALLKERRSVLNGIVEQLGERLPAAV